MLEFIEGAQPYLTFMKDLATVVSLGIAAVVAIKGLETWRRQLKGTSDYDLARRLLKASYRLRDALQYVRMPFMSAGEVAHAVKEAQLELKPTDENYHAATTAAAYQLRWKPVVEAYQGLELEVTEAEALWGPNVKAATLLLRKSVNSLSTAIDMVLRDMHSTSGRVLDSQSRESFERILYSVSHDPEEDKFLKELFTATAEIESLARPFLVK